MAKSKVSSMQNFGVKNPAIYAKKVKKEASKVELEKKHR